MTYKEFRKASQSRFDEAMKNVFFVFTKKSLEEKAKAQGLALDDLVSIGYGGYCSPDTARKIEEVQKTVKLELEGLLLNDNFLLDAFEYEARNFECMITDDYSDAFNVLSIDYEKLKPDTQKKVNKVIKKLNAQN